MRDLAPSGGVDSEQHAVGGVAQTPGEVEHDVRPDRGVLGDEARPIEHVADGVAVARPRVVK